MTKYFWTLAGTLILLLSFTMLNCNGDEAIEGDEGGECSDGADNDQDGLFDCNDPGCYGSPDCDGSGDDDDDDNGDDDPMADDDAPPPDADDAAAPDDDDSQPPDDDDDDQTGDDDTGEEKGCKWLCDEIDYCGWFGSGPWGNDAKACDTWCVNTLGDPPSKQFLMCIELYMPKCDQAGFETCL